MFCQRYGRLPPLPKAGTCLLYTSLALTDPEIAEALAGRVVFYAVPSEECGEVDFKKSLMDQGIIRYPVSYTHLDVYKRQPQG